jgi:hypothetical protein
VRARDRSIDGPTRRVRINQSSIVVVVVACPFSSLVVSGFIIIIIIILNLSHVVESQNAPPNVGPRVDEDSGNL